jgi:hypothetical protein
MKRILRVRLSVNKRHKAEVRYTLSESAAFGFDSSAEVYQHKNQLSLRCSSSSKTCSELFSSDGLRLQPLCTRLFGNFCSGTRHTTVQWVTPTNGGQRYFKSWWRQLAGDMFDS